MPLGASCASKSPRIGRIQAKFDRLFGTRSSGLRRVASRACASEVGSARVVNSEGSARKAQLGGSTRGGPLVPQQFFASPGSVENILELTPLRNAFPVHPLDQTLPQLPQGASALHRVHRLSPNLAPREPKWLSRPRFRRTSLQPAQCVARSPNLPSTAPGGSWGGLAGGPEKRNRGAANSGCSPGFARRGRDKQILCRGTS